MLQTYPSDTDKLTEVAETQAQESFTEPENTSETEALGIAISKHFGWAGEPIVETFLAALEDSNFHTFREKVEDLWEQEKASLFAKKR